MARLFLTAGESYGPIGGISTTNVFGTNDVETIFIAADGKATLDGSFNRGGDIIDIAGAASSYNARLSGSSVVLTNSAGAQINIPVGSAGTTVRFDDLESTLKLDGGAAKLGTTTIATTSAPIIPPVTGEVVPIIVLAGQSNAELPPVAPALVNQLAQLGGAYEFVSRTAGGTSLFANGGADWDPASNDELTDELIERVNLAIANVEAQGQVADVKLLWIQGENDAGRTTEAYLAKLTEFFNEFRTGTGQPDAQIVISPLPIGGNVRTAQFEAAATLSNVDIIESRGIPTIDGVHYIDEAGDWLAGQFLDVARPAPVDIPGYTNLLPQGSFTVAGNQVTIESTLGDFIFNASDGRNYKITSRGGADEIFLGAGVDFVTTGTGEDFVSAGAGGDTIDSGAGNDTLFGGDGGDFIVARDGADYVSGGDGGDTILLGAGDDIALGGAGNDTIVGEGGADTLLGGDGADVFVYTAPSHSLTLTPDFLPDFLPGTDRLRFEDLGELTFVGDAAFTGTGQIRTGTVANDTFVYLNLSGDLNPEMAIKILGQLTITSADIAFA